MPGRDLLIDTTFLAITLLGMVVQEARPRSRMALLMLRDLASRAWEAAAAFFWAVIFWLLVGKTLPKHDCVSPPCQAAAAAAGASAQNKKLEVSIVSAFYGSTVLITGARCVNRLQLSAAFSCHLLRI